MNYKSFYSICGNLFNNNNEPFISSNYSQALKRFNYIIETSGVALFVGPSGTGKTYAIQKFISSIDRKQYDSHYLSVYNLSPVMLATYIGNSFEISNCFWLNIIISDILLHVKKNSAKHIKTIFVFDNIHSLDVKALDVINSLILILEPFKAIFILIGEDSIIPKITSFPLSQIGKRIIIDFSFTPLLEDEVISYIKLRLSEVSLSIDLFTSNALKSIYLNTNGNPREINILLGNCFLVGEARNQKIINKEIVFLAKELTIT